MGCRIEAEGEEWRLYSRGYCAQQYDGNGRRHSAPSCRDGCHHPQESQAAAQSGGTENFVRRVNGFIQVKAVWNLAVLFMLSLPQVG